MDLVEGVELISLNQVPLKFPPLSLIGHWYLYIHNLQMKRVYTPLGLQLSKQWLTEWQNSGAPVPTVRRC
jgi:hypothetical protein